MNIAPERLPRRTDKITGFVEICGSTLCRIEGGRSPIGKQDIIELGSGVGATMNEQLEAFRRRLHGASQPSRERMKGKDWIAIVVSLVALGISALTVYFNVIRQSEEMRVMIGQYPVLYRTADDHLEVEGSLDIAFVNTATRPIIVQGVGLVIADVSKRKDPDSPCGASWGSISFDVESFVVKEKESIAKLLKFRIDPRGLFGTANLTKEGRVWLQAPKNDRGEPSRHVVACVQVYGATPSRAGLFADMALAEFEWQTKGPNASGFATVLVQTQRNHVIWARRGTIFNMD